MAWVFTAATCLWRAVGRLRFALEALVGTAQFGRCVDLDLWRYQTEYGRDPRAAPTGETVGSYWGRIAL